MLLACVALAAGCSGGPSGPYSVITGFPAEKAPESVPEHRLDDNIGVYDISMVGDYILVAEKRTGHFYTLYDRELNRICGFANKGRGPGEYLAPAYYGEYEITDGGNPVLSVYDRALFHPMLKSGDVFPKYTGSPLSRPKVPSLFTSTYP